MHHNPRFLAMSVGFYRGLLNCGGQAGDSHQGALLLDEVRELPLGL